MITALTIVHVIVSILLVLFVLLQFGKGAEAGFFSDTSGQGVFAGASQGNILTKITTILAILFLGLAIVLANLRGRERASSILDGETPAVAPLGTETTAPAAAPSNAVKKAVDKVEPKPASQEVK